MEQTNEPSPEESVPPQAKLAEFKIQAPAGVTPQQLDAALRIGFETMGRVRLGQVMIYFPHVAQDDKGKDRVSVQNYAMQAIDAIDITRLLQIAEATNKANLATINAKHVGTAGDHLSASVMGERHKAAAAESVTATIDGKPKIIIP